uniref:Uncharacterized protein n=1 Tax=Arundo donax TaxID=35708 RepID=A0A0A9G8E8_ARUDO
MTSGERTTVNWQGWLAELSMLNSFIIRISIRRTSAHTLQLRSFNLVQKHGTSPSADQVCTFFGVGRAFIVKKHTAITT